MSTGSTEVINKIEVNLKGIIGQIQQLRAESFTGKLSIRSVGNNCCFAFVFRLGRLTWLSSNVDPSKYWRRQLTKYQPDLPQDWLNTISDENNPWVSAAELADLMIEGTLDRPQLMETITAVAIEVFFDLIQVSKIIGDQFVCDATTQGEQEQKNPTGTESEDAESNRSSVFLPMMEVDVLIKSAIQAWQEWQSVHSAAFSPNLFPIIQKPDLIAALPQSRRKEIFALMTGTETIRDLASKHNQNLLELATALLQLLQLGTITLSKTPRANQPPLIPATPAVPKKGVTIACVDDSPLVYQSLKQILEANGYECYGVQEPLTIMPRLIKQKPDFIFLDLLMPIINGYEVCGQIRKTPSLKDIPVVILTGKDGLVDRMRSKLVGSTDFMSKPVSSETVLKMLDKYLPIRSQS
jgi:two-component system, chemotaxis family, response regulator PixG